jgi:hypothetical protein
VGHVVRDTGRWVLDIDTTKGYVFLQTRWQYSWLTSGAVSNWTYREMKKFHDQVDRHIWSSWSNRAKLRVAGAADFCKRFAGKDIPIDLDVKWVTKDPHWQANITKVPPGTFVTSNIVWNTKTVNLDTEDVNSTVKCNDVPNVGAEALYAALPDWLADHNLVKSALTQNVCHNQVPAAHEFGHVAGNTGVLNRGDEYNRTSPHIRDAASIVNIGSQLRDRHFQTILDELNVMIPGCTFSVHSIKN